MQNKTEHMINFQPIGRRVAATGDKSVLTIAQDAGIDIASICGGTGICDSCKIRLVKGELSELTLEEKGHFINDELLSDYRLACQSYPRSDLTIEIPPDSLTAPQRLQIEGQEQLIQVNPVVVPVEVVIPKPTINDLRSDTERLRDSLREKGIALPVTIDISVLQSLSTLIREHKWEVELAMRYKFIVAILPPGTQLLGLAVDIGTTKLAAYLCDLSTGAILSKAGAMNPQTAFGEDVISRISYANNSPQGGYTLQTRLIGSINQLVDGMCEQLTKTGNPITPNQIADAVVVGNTAMHHLFAGLPVRQLGVAPFVPAVGEAIEIEASKLGLNIAPGAKVYLPPNIAGYVGADHVAMLLATGIWESTKTAIALDIGTNTEISLVHQNQIIACSCASGPAFEGAHISAGMRAAPGAIERVQVVHGEVRTQTIDNLAPVGICGSGILDAVACMLQINAIDQRGAIAVDHPSVKHNDHRREFLLVKQSVSGNNQDIMVTRQDVNEIQLAKGAIRTGIDILLEVAGISADDIEEFIIAGAFGSYIHIPSAVQIGMFPAIPLNRFHQVGNAAGAGARQMLLSAEQRELAQEVAKKVRYVELSTYPGFSSIFSRSLFF